MKPTILSSSIVIGAVLQDKVSPMVTKIFPVIAVKDAETPYIRYIRTKLTHSAVKNDLGPTGALVQVDCCTNEYSEGVELAEAVREALDGRQCRVGDISMRSCIMIDGGEDYRDDTFIQTLIFQVKI